MDKQVAIFYRNLGPYHLARLRAFAKLHPKMSVVEISNSHREYKWQVKKKNLTFAVKTLFAQSLHTIKKQKLKKQILSYLTKNTPEVVVVAGYDYGMRIVTNWAKKKKIPAVSFFSTTELDRKRMWWKEFLKKRFIMKKFSHIAASGKKSADYVQKLGVKKENVSVIGNVVDNQEYAKQAKTVRNDEKNNRKKLSLPDNYFLFVGRFSSQKNLKFLVDAFSDYKEKNGTWDLALIGDGPMKNYLKKYASRKEGKQYIHFLSWKQMSELPAYYALAGCLILPSLSEPWGLVVNEAMTCGLPVLVSKKCGCVSELCKDGINGYTFDPKDMNRLVKLMMQCSNGDFDLNSMGNKSLEVISEYTPDKWAKSLNAIIKNII